MLHPDGILHARTHTHAPLSRQVDKVLYQFLPLIVQAVSGAICYYFARVACKLCMQGFGFSLPLTLITPATGAIFCYLCFLQRWTRITLPDMDIGEEAPPVVFDTRQTHCNTV